MTRTVLFDSPYLVGFDDMRGLIERVARSHDSYPPYNVEALSPDHLRICIAVAGFTAAQLRVEVRGAHLTIAAAREQGPERDYLHRGIALRAFTRAFVLSDSFEVTRAKLEHGLLNIDLHRPQPSEEVKVIPIEA